ncbi:Protein translocase subunit SecE [Candidatus Ecksteinia adelgidicola]|nr:Protein translocase subunit SecE [Candidatus Ecksteinia adelgidicola]
MNINIKRQKKKNSAEKIKWFVISILLIIAVVGNYFFQNLQVLLRVVLNILIIIIIGIMFIITKKGQTLITFAQAAHNEMRQVIWPTRQETLHTALIIIAVTAIASLILWGLDGIFIRMISFITSLRF